MIHTTKMYLDYFRGVDLRRTKISAIGLMIQSVSLGNVMAFAVYFFEQAGIDNGQAFTSSIVQHWICWNNYFLGFVIQKT